MESILKKVEQVIDLQMKGKFGLTDEESAKVATVLKEYWKDLIPENKIGNQIQSALKNIKDKSTSMKNMDLVEELMKKAGISEEKAKMIKEFSMKDVAEQLKAEFLNEDGKPDWTKISAEAKELFAKLKPAK